MTLIVNHRLTTVKTSVIRSDIKFIYHATNKEKIS